MATRLPWAWYSKILVRHTKPPQWFIGRHIITNARARARRTMMIWWWWYDDDSWQSHEASSMVYMHRLTSWWTHRSNVCLSLSAMVVTKPSECCLYRPARPAICSVCTKPQTIISCMIKVLHGKYNNRDAEDTNTNPNKSLAYILKYKQLQQAGCKQRLPLTASARGEPPHQIFSCCDVIL